MDSGFTPPSAALSGGLAQRLLGEGLLDAEGLRHAQQAAARAGRSLLAELRSRKLVPEARLLALAAAEFGLPLVDLEALEPDPEAVQAVPLEQARSLRVLPLHRRGQRLFVAVDDPTTDAVDRLAFHTGLVLDPVLADPAALDAALARLGEAEADPFADLADAGLEEIEVEAEEDVAASSASSEVDDAPVVRFVHKLMLDAVNAGASDLHFEPYEDRYRVRMRVDGVLREVVEPPRALAPRIAARLKVMARLDVSERRLPQDGRTKLRLSRHRHIDFRVSTCPTLHGEKVVLRVLESQQANLHLESLGMEADQLAAFLAAIEQPHGMILVTGPTGSGKTVTLYSALQRLNTPDRNISTAEDPAEINLPGINQVNINPKVGLTFATAMRAFLRQDPDVIMVGEIRDLETADMAIKAAQTGHLVLSTLHTNDAPQAVVRLLNMGVKGYNIAASLSLVVAQRLVRKLCPHCRRPVRLPEAALREAGFSAEEAASAPILYEPEGCERCHGGYRGRTGIFQVMPFDETMQRLVLDGGEAHQVAARAAELGIIDLRRAGLNKVLAGVTALTEVDRVTRS